VLRRDAAGRSCARLPEPVGRDHRRQRPRRPIGPVGEREQADDELELALDDRVALQPGDAEAAVGCGHHGEHPALDLEAASRHQLDLTRGHPQEALLDHGQGVAGRDERRDVDLGEPERHDSMLRRPA
jgi:hypothetical protein